MYLKNRSGKESIRWRYERSQNNSNEWVDDKRGESSPRKLCTSPCLDREGKPRRPIRPGVSNTPREPNHAKHVNNELFYATPGSAQNVAV